MPHDTDSHAARVRPFYRDRPDPTGTRFTLDFETWRAHIAAPGSRFDSSQPAPLRIVRLDAISRTVESPEAERRTA